MEDYSVCFVTSSAAGAPLPPGKTSLPGGLVDLADVALARANVGRDANPAPLARRIAAVRHTFEDAGMLIGGRPPPTFAREPLRQIMHRDGPTAFSAFLQDWRVNLQPYAFDELASFVLPSYLAVDMDAEVETHVFVVQAPDAEEVSFASAAEGAASHQVRWAKPSEALRWHQSGEFGLSLPQWYILKLLQEKMPKLAGLPNFLASDLATNLHVCPFEPCVLEERGRIWLTLPGDKEHPHVPGPPGGRNRVLVDSKALPGVRALHLEGLPPQQKLLLDTRNMFDPQSLARARL